MPLPAELTVRERQVFERVVRGDQTKEIAKALGLSPRTVELYRSNVLRKTGSRNAVELVRKSSTSADLVDGGGIAIRKESAGRESDGSLFVLVRGCLVDWMWPDCHNFSYSLEIVT